MKKLVIFSLVLTILLLGACGGTDDSSTPETITEAEIEMTTEKMGN